MKRTHFKPLLTALLLAASAVSSEASIAYGSINNFDTVNDTGHECHGFEIELEDCHSTGISYTYNYNHYGVPKITEDNSIPGHPKCIIRWESAKKPDGSWAAYTAIPSGPIAPTDGHKFTNPNINFGGEHFGVGYMAPPSAIHYNWLIDDGAGNLVHGGVVQVATPVFTYYPPVAAGVPAQVQAAIQPPEPPEIHVKEFGDPVWVKEIRTTSHNNNEVKLRDLVSDDPDDENDKNWKNGEPDEVETEWQLLQTEFNQVDGGPNGNKQANPEDLNNGDEVVTRRYEFYKYTGPIDDETGEALCDSVGADNLHGDGIKDVNGVEVDFSTMEVVGEYNGAQMAAVDVEASVGLTEHVCDGRINEPYAARTVVIQGVAPFTAVMTGTLPDGMTFDAVTGILSGTPVESGEFSFTVKASDENTPEKEKKYTFIIAAAGEDIAPHCLLDTASSPVAGGITTGSDSYAVNADATVTATANEGFTFTNWTSNGKVVSADASLTVTMNINQSLVANFVAGHMISLDALPVEGGVVSGGGAYDDGTPVTVTATANSGFTFANWTEDGLVVSVAASYTFNAVAPRILTANFTAAPLFNIALSAAPTVGGTVAGGGAVASGVSTTVTATANAGYAFVNWTVNGAAVSNQASYTFTVTADRSLVANFVVDSGMRTITTSSNPSSGGTTSGGGSYAVGSEVTVHAVPSANYMFKRWQAGGANVSTAADYTFTVSTNRALTARFVRVYPVTTSSNPPQGGTIEIDGTFEDGDNVTVTASANPGYTFVNWTEGAQIVSEDPEYKFKANPARNLVANFSGAGPVTWTISAAAQPAASGTVSGGGIVTDGANVTLNAVPAAGFQFLKWTENGVEVSNTASFSLVAGADRTFAAVFIPQASGVIFDFDTGPLPAIPGAALPLDQMAAGITASFSSPDAAGFTVTPMAQSGQTIAAFSGNCLKPGEGTTVLEAGFDQSLTGVSLKFALLENPAAAHSTLRITAYDTSSGIPAEVGTATAVGAVIPGDSLAGGVLTISTEVTFNGIRIEIENAAQAGSSFLCDNLSVIPGAIGGGNLLLANPNWNITLTDSGYSDFLFDNTPGFEGREYLSGEWGAAVSYTVGNTTMQPTWLEPRFLFPDWDTNSDFHVVMPISLVASNADGLPVAQSILANNDLEITIRYEMVDTVTGMPMGVAASSAAGTGNSVGSNRYVLNQAYTIRNISGSTITGLNVFQLLHGFTSQRGVFDNRTYPGKLSTYHHDVTLAGIDAGTIGAGGSSASGLEDYIGFSSSVAPTAFEIGHYGIEGIDDHGTAKPSDGVHLSIEADWATAPYSDRQGTDFFAPNDRWIAGAQRYALGSIADGQSVSVDVMLSILTGTTVQVTGGGEHHNGSGSCNGGSSHVGGVDFEIEDVTEDGTFFGEESEADDDELQDRIEDGEFVLPGFQQPGALSQVWNLHYTGAHNGLIKLTFAYDPALLPPGFDESRITIYHFHSGAWEQMVGTVDPARHTVTIRTASLSPFMLGVSTPNAIPALRSESPDANTLRLKWQGDTNGWILQENATLDEAGWTNSTAPVTQTAQGFEASMSSGLRRCFFRLLHP